MTGPRDYIIRFREGILVEDTNCERKPASAWVNGGRARMLKDARVRVDGTAIPAVVVVHAKGMNDALCLATSRVDLRAPDVLRPYECSSLACGGRSRTRDPRELKRIAAAFARRETTIGETRLVTCHPSSGAVPSPS